MVNKIKTTTLACLYLPGIVELYQPELALWDSVQWKDVLKQTEITDMAEIKCRSYT